MSGKIVQKTIGVDSIVEEFDRLGIPYFETARILTEHGASQAFALRELLYKMLEAASGMATKKLELYTGSKLEQRDIMNLGFFIKELRMALKAGDRMLPERKAKSLREIKENLYGIDPLKEWEKTVVEVDDSDVCLS